MTTFASLLPRITAQKTLADIFTTFMSLSVQTTVWSDKEAELSSHIEILINLHWFLFLILKEISFMLMNFFAPFPNTV